MRVLHVVHQYLPEYVGGTELYTHWLTQALHRRGYAGAVFYRRRAEGQGLVRRSESGVDVWAAWAGLLNPARRFLATFHDPGILRAFGEVLTAFSPDLVHIQHLMGLPVGLIRMLRRRQIPFLVTLHDYWWVCANAQLLTNDTHQVCDGPSMYVNCVRCALARSESAWLWPMLPSMVPLFAYRNTVLRDVLQSAAGLIAPTPFVRGWYGRHRAPIEKIHVVPHGLELANFNSAGEYSSGETVRFVYIGGISWQKGIHVLLEAFKQVSGRWELWVAGDETFDPGYATNLRANAVENVRFLGKLTRAEVRDTLGKADVVLVPSLWYETFSIVISEAFAAGVPVVASNIGALADRVRDGADGVLVPPGDVPAWREALQRIVDDRAWLRHLQGNVSAPCTLDEHVDQIVSLYGNA
jgi:glycosyltransferase involved in cell wall biosynthesis